MRRPCPLCPCGKSYSAMTPLALGIVLIAAFTHATWNYAAKRSGGGLPFVWLTGLLSFAFYVPAVTCYWLWRQPVLPSAALFLFVGSGLIKTAYALLLQRGYRHGDFSLVYPLARGTGPLLSTLAAMALFGARPTPLALAGGAIIVTCLFYLTGGAPPRRPHRAPPAPWLVFRLPPRLCLPAPTNAEHTTPIPAP